MTSESLDKLRNSLSIKSKNGLDFTLSACFVWILITIVWTLDKRAYDKSVLTFIVGSLMLPMTLVFSKIFRTVWSDKDNPLQPLGLWFNFSQLFYFPFLVFILVKMPDYFVMTYAIITGAHFFPYAWFYRTSHYAVFAGIISVGALISGLFLKPDGMYLIPLFMSVALFILTVLLFIDFNRKRIIVS